MAAWRPLNVSLSPSCGQAVGVYNVLQGAKQTPGCALTLHREILGNKGGVLANPGHVRGCRVRLDLGAKLCAPIVSIHVPFVCTTASQVSKPPCSALHFPDPDATEKSCPIVECNFPSDHLI